MPLPEILQIPVTVLARTYGIFYPHRRASSAALYELQRDFHLRGIALSPPDASEAGRKAFSRTVAQLARQGVLRRFKNRADSRTLSVKLLPAGEKLTYSLLGLPDAEECAVDWLREIIAFEGHPESGGGPFAGHVPEYLPAKTAAWGPTTDAKLLDVEARMSILPAQRQWVEASRTTRGHIYYRVTPLGRRIATGQERIEIPEVDAPPASGEALEFFGQQFGIAIASVRAAQPVDPNEIGSIPLPAAITTNAQIAARRGGAA